MKTNEKPKLGRPFLEESERKKSITFWISRDVLAAIDLVQKNRSHTINKILRQALKDDNLL